MRRNRACRQSLYMYQLSQYIRKRDEGNGVKNSEIIIEFGECGEQVGASQ